MVLTGSRLLAYKINLKLITLISLLYGYSIWIVRQLYTYLNIPYGSHSLVLMAILFLIIKIVGKIRWNISFWITLISFSLVMAGSIFSSFVVEFFNLEVDVILNTPWLYVIIGQVENSFLILFLIINYIFGFSLRFNKYISQIG